MLKSRRRSGAVTTEVAVGIGLAVVVLFVAIGLFNDNISAMISNSSIANIFNSGGKTTYSSFNRDYSDSQVNVQIMGEQGLGMLRQRANNKSIDIINQDFSSGNTDGSSIAYLALSIQILSGEPHTCVYMKKDSNKPCNQDDIGGYNYRIDVNSSTITIGKVTDGESVSSVGKSVTLNVDPGILSAFNNAINSAGTSAIDSQKLTAAQKYQILSDTSEALDPLGPKAYKHVRSDAILIRKMKHNPLSKISVPLQKNLIEFAKDIYDDAVASNMKCSEDSCGLHISGEIKPTGELSGELLIISTWKNNLISDLNALDNPTDQEVANVFNKNLSKELLGILNDDKANDYKTPKDFAANLYLLCVITHHENDLGFLSVKSGHDKYYVGDYDFLGKNYCGVKQSEVMASAFPFLKLQLPH